MTGIDPRKGPVLKRKSGTALSRLIAVSVVVTLGASLAPAAFAQDAAKKPAAEATKPADKKPDAKPAEKKPAPAPKKPAPAPAVAPTDSTITLPQNVKGIVVTSDAPVTLDFELEINRKDPNCRRTPARSPEPHFGRNGVLTDRGFYEGIYENGNGYIPLQTANNNGIILAALLYKVQEPILQSLNTNTQVWDTALANTDIRNNKCHPKTMQRPVSCCNCADLPQVEPPVPVSEFKYCRHVYTVDGLAATDCSTEEHRLAPPEPEIVLPKQCVGQVRQP